MNVTIERERCTSCGNCVLAAPDVFDLDEDDARVILLVDQVPSELEPPVRQAAADCPVDVIVVTN